MLDDGEAQPEKAEARDDEVRAARELAQHRAGIVQVGGLAVQAAVEVDGRVDTERDGALDVDRARLAFRVVADERDGVGVGRVVLDVRRGDDGEGDPELLEDRTALRRRRGERERRRHRGFFATQISSLGHLRAHSTENAS